MRPFTLSLLTFLLAGCTTPKRDAAAESRGYERGYRQATKEQYWIIQNQQRAVPPALPNPANTP